MNYFDRFLNERQAKMQTESTSQKALKTIAYYAQKDKNKASELYDFYMKSSTDPTSKYYSGIYSAPTNQAVSNLAALGFDTSVLNSEWYEANKNWIRNNLEYRSGSTNAPSAPTKKSSWENKVAYELYQWGNSEAQTQEAENQWKSLQDDLYYWANRKDRNYSDEEILDTKIDWSKYNLLKEMKDDPNPLNPKEYNRAIGYSQDAVYGTLWAARNGGGTGNALLDAGNYYLGIGNQWQENQEIEAKLDPTSQEYKPYSIGSTNLDNEARLFGVSYFGKDWLSENINILKDGTTEEIAAYQKIQKAEENTQTAENAVNAVITWADQKLKNTKSPEDAKKKLDDLLAKGKVYVGANGKVYTSSGKDRQEVDLSILNKMDVTMGKDGKNPTGDLIAMTRSVDYKYDDLLDNVLTRCQLNDQKETGNAVISKVTGSEASQGASGNPVGQPYAGYAKTEQANALADAHDKVLREGADAVEDVATPAEQNAFEKMWSVTFDSVKQAWDDLRSKGIDFFNTMVSDTIRKSISKTGSAVLEGTDTIAEYEQRRGTIDKLYAREQELQNELGNLVLYGQQTSDIGEIRIDFNGNNLQLNLLYDEALGEYTVHSIYNLTTGSKDVSNLDQEALDERLTGVLAGVTANRNNTINANNQTVTAEQQKLIDEYNAIQRELDGLSSKQKEEQAAYDEAVRKMDDAQKTRTATIQMLQDAGLPNEILQDFENTDVVINAIKDFTKYDPTEWESYNAYDLYAREFLFDGSYAEVFAAAKEGDEKTQEEIETVQWMLDYSDRMGIQIPEGTRKNMERYIAKLERNHKDYEYFALIGNDDFESGAENGREIVLNGKQFDWSEYRNTGSIESQPLFDLLSDEEKQALRNEEANYKNGFSSSEYMTNMYEDMTADIGLEDRMFGLFMVDNLLTDYEKETYYYLLGTKGVDAAEEYYTHLSDNYGVLNKRSSEIIAEGAEELADQGFLGRRAADVLSMILAPAAAVGSFAYGAKQAYNKLTGQETEYNPNDPMLSFNTFRTSAREEINREIIRAYGEGTFLQKVASGLQEMVSNRGDSIMNAMAFGWLTNGFSNAMLEQFVGALPMATSAAFDAMSEAKEKGASEEQLWAIGGITLLAESITEAVTLGNIKQAFGSGEDITAQTVKDFLKDWLTKNGVEEMFGESVNDIVEYIADKNIMGELSDHEAKIREYMDSGEFATREEAEEAAWRDMISGVLHTALISYLSPGLDIVSFGAGRLNYYRDQTRNAQEHGANLSLIDVMRSDKAIRDRVNAGIQAAETAPAAPQEGQAPIIQAAEQVAQKEASKQGQVAPEERAGIAMPEEAQRPVLTNDLTTDYVTLDNVDSADESSQTAAIASVLDLMGTDASADVAKAAAANIDNLTGVETSAVEFMKDIVLGAHESGTDRALVMTAIQNAALSQNSAAFQATQTSEYAQADIDLKAQMLASTVERDAANAIVTNEIARAVYDNRVAQAEKEIILNGGLKGTQKAQEIAAKSVLATNEAQGLLEEKQQALDAAKDNLETITEQFNADPSMDNLKQQQAAITQVDNADESLHQYEQHLEKAQDEQERAEANLEQVRNEEMTSVRQQAEQIVAQQDTDRAAAAAQAEEEARIQAEMEAQRKAKQEENDNALTADTEAFIAMLENESGPLTEDEKQTVRERFAQGWQEYQNQQQLEQQNQQAQAEQQDQQEVETDEFGRLDDESARNRKKFVNEVSRRFGVQIDVIDTEKESKAKSKDGKGFRSEGYFDNDTGHIVLDENTTADDMMYRVLTHELTHIAEKSGMYDQLANSILRIMYGDGADYQAAVKNLEANGVPHTKLEADILARKKRYENRLNRELSYEYAAQEVIADRMGEVLNSKDEAKRQDYINRLVSDSPSTARRILDSIKRFIKQAVGMKGAWLSNAQKTVDMLEAALNEVQGKNSPIAEQKYSLNNDYIDAVDRGDMEAAQKDVDAYAKQAGYTTKAYHGTTRQFNAFRFTSDDLGIHLGTKGQARMMAGRGKDARIIEAYVKLENPIHFERDLGAWEGKRVAKELYDMGIITEQEAANALLSPDRTYRLSDEKATKNIRDLLISKGYDGFVYDNDFEGYSKKSQQSIAVFNPNQIKLADAVAYDSQGNVIPLDQRFTDSSDIRYSLSDEAQPAAVDDDGTELTGEFKDGTQVKYSLNSWTEEEQKRVRADLIKKGFSRQKADKWIKDTNSIASMIAEDRTRLDFLASDNQVFLKPNNDYYFTLDASTLCAKRLLYQGTFDYVQHAMPDEVFTPEDLIDLVNIMNDMGYETPCGICYVESRRRWLDTYANEFLDKVQKNEDDYVEKFIKNKFKKASEEEKAALRKRLAEELPSVDDLTTSDGLENLRRNDPVMYKAFVTAMNAKGSQNPKVVQLRTEYRGDIGKLTKKDIQKVKDIGGLRIQSFSDFETPHLLDMIQAVLDMSSAGLTSQAYTKVPNFAWVFGDTGIKINLSLIGKGTGLDENGNLVFDNREGMNFDEAMKLREKYNKNVGTILVGINDEHIIAAMGDPRIDFIIPFHKSGWSAEELRKMPTLNNYNDYTSSQNEVLIVGDRKHRVKELKDMGMKALDNWILNEGENHPGYKVIEQDNGKYTVTYDDGYETESFAKHKERTGESFSNYEPVGANKYWDFKKSGEWNANKYLKMCAESGRIPKFSQFLVDNGDGSFSLPQGNDKRSTAIREGYWKTLIDFKMYENDGYGRTQEDGTKTKVKGSEQKEVTPNVNMAEAYRVMNEYELGRQMPDKENGAKGAFIPMKSNNDVPVAIPAAERYIELIKQRREGIKPDNPDDTLEASPSIDVGSLGESWFGKGPSDEVNMNAATAFGATDAPAVLGNEGNEYVESGAEQSRMAIDAEGNQVRYSLPSDAPYLSAVNHGDMEEAQRMVDEKAEEAGYVKAGYHGTLNGGFTIFDKAKAGIGGNSGAGFYFSSNPSDSDANYSDVEGADNWFKANHLADRILEEFQNSDEEDFEYEGYKITEGMPYEEVVDIAKKILTKNPQVYNVYLDPGRAYIRDGNKSTNLIEDVINDFDESTIDRNDYDDEDDYYEAVSNARYEEIAQAISDAVYNGFADVDSNYEVLANVNYEDIIGKLINIALDYEVLNYNTIVDVLRHYYIDLATDDMTESADGSNEIARAIVEAFGFDSIEDREVSWKFNQLKNMGNAGDTVHYIMFSPEQIKLADPVTYDNEGNVIPLSERFRHESNDIRYSLPSDDVLDQQIREYLANGGSLSTNATPPADTQLGFPGQQAQRQFGRQTAQSSNALHDEVKDYLYNHSSYTPDSNRRQIDRAMDWVQNMASENDPDGYYAALDAVTSDGFDYRSADGQARMLTVMSMAALKAEAGDRSAMNDELRLADAFNKQGTDLGRQLQARKIFRLMTPMGRQSVLQGMCDQINEQLGRKGINQTVRLSEETLKLAGEAQTEQEFTNVRKQAAKEIAEQIPSNWKDKLRGWRMLSMLGNPRTHIRNVVGNALFVPVVSLKNKLGAVGEIVTRQDQRTKTLAPMVSKEIRDFAKKDALTMKDTLTGEAKYNENSMVEQEQKPFKGLLQAIIDFNGNMLEKEDWTFLKGHYKRALGGWMQANGYTAQQLENDPALLEQGRAYAIQEAQKATYRDFSKLASTLNKVSREGGIAGFITDAVLPFKKTPANILKRGIEYSPAGIMRSLTTDLYHLKQWNDYNNGKLKVLPDKAISPNQFIDRLCSGLSGTAIMAVGALLSSAGIVSCGLDDDEDKLEKEKGNQEYSFKFSIGGKDYTFTVDWAAPMSMPFFVGAAIQEQMANQEGFDVESLVDAFGNITEPVFNLSMLDGVNSLFKTSQYDDTNNLTQIGAKIASNYATSYVPSLMGAIARTVDDTRRKSFVESGKGTGVLGTARYAYEQVQNKIPGWSQTNIPARDVFGNAETSGLAERILENFILPGYVSEYKDDPVLNEMARLYDATNDANMIPKDPDKSVTYKKEKFVLTAEQWDEYKTVRGQTAYSGLTELINSDEYQKANETTQAQMIKNVWSYADKMGKQAVIPGFEMEDMGANPVITVMKDAKITAEKSDMMTDLAKGDYEDYETMVEALREDGVEDSEIKSKISGVYRDKYKEAYRNGDDEQMAEIEEILDNTGFDFDTGAWEDQVDEKYGL